MSRVQLSMNVSDFHAAGADKVCAHDPDGVAWAYYTILEHVETP